MAESSILPYVLVSVFACGFGVICSAVAFFVFVWWANKQAPRTPATEQIDATVLAEVLAEKMAIAALSERAKPHDR